MSERRMITIKCTNLEQAFILCALDKSKECLFGPTAICKGKSCVDCMLESINWIIEEEESK